jgi:Beta-lactamase class C and other penicillin binding proteins
MALVLILGLAGGLPASVAAATPVTRTGIARYAERVMAAAYRPDAPGAAVLVARGDKILFRGARGLADVSTGTPLRADSVFRIGSVSKQFAAAGLLKLVEAGKVSLDDPITKYVPGFPNGEHITVLELLNHTSGVKDYTSIPAWREGAIDKDLSTAQLIAIFSHAKPDFAPGSNWSYSNSGYVLIGAVIEAASGQSWHDYLREALFQPLGLSHTGYGGDPKLAAQQVHGYSLDDGKVVPARVVSMTVPHAAGALVSTVDDLLKWNRALNEGRVLRNSSYLRMITPVGKAREAKYGFGVELSTVQGHPMLDHGGNIFGFESMLEYLQGPDISVIVLQNTDRNDNDKSPEAIARKLAAEALGEPYPQAKAIPMDLSTLKQFEGVYRINSEDARVLRVVNGKLTSQRPGGQGSALTPIATNQFLYSDGLTRIAMQRDAAGTVTAMRFFANGEPPGTLIARSREPLPTLRQEVPLPSEAIERVLGTYAGGEAHLKIFKEGTQLKAQMNGQPAVDIFAESPDHFFLTVVDATLTFAPGKGSPAAVTLSQGGHVTEFRRQP